jgi:IMP dehydrogenase
VPSYSSVVPSQVDTRSLLTRNIELQIPVVSAAMDTVTEAALAIALAREGGIGFIHKNMSIEQQASEVDKVKRSESGMIVDPITLSPEALVSEALQLMAKFQISGVPVTRKGRLVGILTNRDLRFVEDTARPVSELMTHEKLITVPVGTTLDEARTILQRNRIEKLMVVDDDFRLKGLITYKDIQKQIDYPSACKDELGRLRVGAALGVGADLEARAEALVKAGVDVLVVDSAHGHSANVMDAARLIGRDYPAIDLVAGNIATAEAAHDLIGLGVAGLKVGIGPGSTCTTRVVAGVGVPQLTAVSEVARVACAAGVPVISDGGIKFSGDVAKAIAAGASSVMVGNLFAGTEESPGETVLYEGRSYKVYRGMGSVGAMKGGSGDRYSQAGVEEAKLVAEGIEGRVPHRGPLRRTVYQLVGGLRAGMGYCGASTIEELRTRTRFVRVTNAGLRESHPHDVAITREAPNYWTG